MKKHSRDIATILLAGYIVVIFQGYFFELAHFLDHLGVYLQNHATHFHFHHDHVYQHAEFHEHQHMVSIIDAVVASSDHARDDLPHPLPTTFNRMIDMHHLVALLSTPLIPYLNFEFFEYYAFSVIEVSPGVMTPPPKV